MRFIIVFLVLLISACSTNVIEMTPEPTKQAFDLTDSEGDGVINARDNCPESKQGAKVSNDGCGVKSIYTLRHRLDVNFAVNSYEVEEKYIENVKELADLMIKYPGINTLIEGHTSIRGNAHYNLILSKNRALAIKDVLVHKFNIDSERISTVGYGFERLLAEGNSEESHQQNRRIVAEISSDVSFVGMKWTIYSVDNEEG